MTFGSDWGWGADKDEARRIFDTYVDRGGNFVDTANAYTNGTAEELLGEFAHQRRDSLVLATKYTMTTEPGDPNSGGNHRKSMVRSVENSLRRLRTDYIDLLYLHAWDSTTPVEEVLRAMDDLVRAGKILYVGISDTPAWQVSRMQTIADLRGWSRLAALQIEYSLVERTVERDLIPMGRQGGRDGDRRHAFAGRARLGDARSGGDVTDHRGAYARSARGQSRRSRRVVHRRRSRRPGEGQRDRAGLPP
jgi:aryl-alcohol dehydrogenase-like predicted oxidoreductase